MPVKTEVQRDIGHPWDGRPGFDLLYLQSDSQQELGAAVAQAEAKFWQAWLVGNVAENGLYTAVMYKPSGIMQEWHDSPERPWVSVLA